MRNITSISRRSLLSGMAAVGALTTAPVAGTRTVWAQDDLVVGAVYVGAKDDYGWNQGHAVGVDALKNLSGVKVVEEENVPENRRSAKVHGEHDKFRRCPADFCNIVLGTGTTC